MSASINGRLFNGAKCLTCLVILIFADIYMEFNSHKCSCDIQSEAMLQRELGRILLTTHRSVSSVRDILKVISAMPPIGIRSLPVVNSNSNFCIEMGILNTTSQKNLNNKTIHMYVLSNTHVCTVKYTCMHCQIHMYVLSNILFCRL